MSVIYLDKGIVRLYKGETLAIEEVQYSANGVDGWEGTFNPLSHVSTLTPPLIVPGHKYRRVKHAVLNADGSVTIDANWQLPSQYTAEDGEPIELINDGTYIKWKYVSDTTWTNLEEIANLKGLQGDTGPQGKGLEIKRAGSLELRPMVGQPVPVTSGCGCNSQPVVQEACLYLSLGNHKLTTADVGKYFIGSGDDTETYVLATTDHVGEYVRVWNAFDNTNSTEVALSCNSQGMVGLYHELVEYDSVGKIYIFADYLWTELTNIATATGQIKANDTDSFGFLEDKVDNVTIEVTTNNLNVKDTGITFAKLNPNAFGYGITTDNSKYIINPSDIAGTGLTVEGAGITEKLAINPTGLAGYAITLNGVTLDVTPEEFVLADNGITVDNSSPNKKIYVQRGDGITLVANALTVKPLNTGPITVTTDGVGLNIDTDELEITNNVLHIKDSFIESLLPVTGDLTGGTGVTITNGTDAIIGTGTIVDLNLSAIAHDSLNGVASSTAHTAYVLKSTVTTIGDLLVGTGVASVGKIGIGTANQVLQVIGGTPSWQTLPAAAIGGTVTGLVYGNGNANGASNDYARADHHHAITIGNDDLTIPMVDGLTSALASKADTSGTRYEFTTGDIVLISNSGRKFALKVDDAGNLMTTLIP